MLAREIDSIILRLIKVGARVVYHARKWYVQVATAFYLACYNGILFAEPFQHHERRGVSY